MHYRKITFRTVCTFVNIIFLNARIDADAVQNILLTASLMGQSFFFVDAQITD